MKLRFFEYRVPFIHPIRIGGSIQSERKGLYLLATDEDGVSGWGEVAPLDGYGPDTFSEVCDLMTGPIAHYSPSLRFGLDCAQREIQAKHRGISFRETIGPAVRPVIQSALLVGAEPTTARFVKTKVGSARVDDDVNRVLGILSALPASGRLRLDANGIWSKADAFSFAERLREEGGPLFDKIEFIEEPWSGCFDSDPSDPYPIPTGIDESFNPDVPSWLRADVVLIKPALFGSIGEFLQAKNQAERAGKRLVVASAFETSLGMSAIVALSSTFDGGAEGFGTHKYLVSDPLDTEGFSGLEQESFEKTPETEPFHWLRTFPIMANHVLDIPGSRVRASNLKEVGG